MPSLMWECACGADNPAAAHACDTCGRVPGLAPDPVEATAPVGRRRSLPFSAAGRKGAGGRERAIARPPAGAPGPTRSLLDVGPMVAAPLKDLPVVEPAPVAAVEMPAMPEPEAAPAAALGVAAPEAAATPAAALAAAAAPAKPKPKRSFFDPEPEPGPEPSAAERRRNRLTPTAIAAIVAIVIALGVLAYVIVNTGNSAPPPQAGLGATAGAVLLA